MQGLMDGDSHLQGCEMVWHAWVDGWHLALALASCGWLSAAGEKLCAVGQAGLEQSSLVSTNRGRRRAGCLKRTWSAPNFSRGAGRSRQRLRISPLEKGIRNTERCLHRRVTIVPQAELLID